MHAFSEEYRHYFWIGNACFLVVIKQCFCVVLFSCDLLCAGRSHRAMCCCDTFSLWCVLAGIQAGCWDHRQHCECSCVVCGHIQRTHARPPDRRHRRTGCMCFDLIGWCFVILMYVCTRLTSRMTGRMLPSRECALRVFSQKNKLCPSFSTVWAVLCCNMSDYLSVHLFFFFHLSFLYYSHACMHACMHRWGQQGSGCHLS